MINCNIKRGGTVKVSANGTIEEITCETLVLLKQIYLNIKKDNPEAAEQYKRSIIVSTLDQRSPVWKEGQE